MTDNVLPFTRPERRKPVVGVPTSKPTAPAETGNLVRITLDVATNGPAFPAEVAEWVAAMAMTHDANLGPDYLFLSVNPVADKPRRR